MFVFVFVFTHSRTPILPHKFQALLSALFLLRKNSRNRGLELDFPTHTRCFSPLARWVFPLLLALNVHSNLFWLIRDGEEAAWMGT